MNSQPAVKTLLQVCALVLAGAFLPTAAILDAAQDLSVEQTYGGEAYPYAFRVTRHGDTNVAVSLDYSTTTNGTARPGVDYLPASDRLTLAPGETSREIVKVINTPEVEPLPWGRWIDLVLADPSPGARLLRTNVQCFLVDDEIPSTLDLRFAPAFDRWPRITSVAVQPDGRIVLAGSDLFIEDRRGPLMRLQADGTLDAAFQPEVPRNVALAEIAVAPDSRILARGSLGGTNGFFTRLLPSGVRDPAFAPAPGPSGSLVVQADGKVILWNAQGLRRLQADGSDDIVFNQNVLAALSGLSPGIQRVALQPSSGKLLVFAWDSSAAGVIGRRLNLDGSWDNTFVTVGLLNFGTSPYPRVLMQSDGRFLVRLAEVAGVSPLVRFNADGTPDGSFREPAPPDGWHAGAPVAQVGGRIYYQNGDRLSRSDSNGVMDPSFSVRFRDLWPFGRANCGGCGPRLTVVSGPGSLLCWWDSAFAANEVLRPLARIVLDAAPLPGFIFELDSPYDPWFRAKESVGAFTTRIRRTGNTANPITVHYATRDGTARAGINYIATEGTLTFNPLEVEKWITVPLIQDTVFRGKPSFLIELSAPSLPAALDLPLEVGIYDRELGIALVSVFREQDGSVSLQCEITGPEVIYPVRGGFEIEVLSGQSALDPYVLEQAPDLRTWSEALSQSIDVDFSGVVSIRVPPGEPHGFYRLRRK